MTSIRSKVMAALVNKLETVMTGFEVGPGAVQVTQDTKFPLIAIVEDYAAMSAKDSDLIHRSKTRSFELKLIVEGIFSIRDGDAADYYEIADSMHKAMGAIVEESAKSNLASGPKPFGLTEVHSVSVGLGGVTALSSNPANQKDRFDPRFYIPVSIKIVENF